MRGLVEVALCGDLLLERVLGVLVEREDVGLEDARIWSGRWRRLSRGAAEEVAVARYPLGSPLVEGR